MNTFARLVAASLFVLTALAPPGSEAIAADRSAAEAALADTAFAHQDWAAAARGYEAVVRSEPGNGRAWYRLGVASSSLGRWPRAIEAYRHADASGLIQPAFARYNLACAFARAGMVDSSLAALQSLVATGYRQASQLENDDDLAAVRADARFAPLLARARRNAEPCAERPESRQFDFWIGEWNVTSNRNAGAPAGSSRVEAILGKCVIFENWTSRGGGSGKSFNAWNPDLGCWQQNWMDDSGNVTNYGDGRLVDGAMRFVAEKKDAAGRRQVHRLTFFPLGPDQVRQLGEHSDDGATWQVDYDFDYRRVK